MTMARELKAVVVMDNEVYGPGYINPPPDHIAERITNPSCWGEVKSDDESEDTSPEGDNEGRTPQIIEGNEPSVPTAPAVPTESAPAEEKDDVQAPPRSGRGSGLEAWRAFADAKGVSYPADADRDDIIKACEDAKVI